MPVMSIEEKCEGLKQTTIMLFEKSTLFTECQHLSVVHTSANSCLKSIHLQSEK